MNRYTPNKYIYIYIRGVTVHKIHGSVRYDTVVSRFGKFSIWGVGPLVTSQFSMLETLQTKCKIYADSESPKISFLKIFKFIFKMKTKRKVKLSVIVLAFFSTRLPTFSPSLVFD